VGGEYGILSRKKADLYMAVAFPDLYEIGMSNQAIRILYNRLNELDGISCDRVFAPAVDFENLLQEKNVPLYTLDNGFALSEIDILGFSLGYELGITGVLSILSAGRVPIRAKDRGEAHPLVFLGGPAASNPIPFGRFVDAVWIGEAEDSFFDLMVRLRDAKKTGATRGELLSIITTEDAVWVPGKKARRAIDHNFSLRKASSSVYPVPSMKVVQDHGAVEIMRGCPNGCRFCHAGIWYRPMRQKDESTVLQEVDDFIQRGGYREVTLSSLSSGDYQGIASIVSQLNKKYSSRHVSFQLPSLKVSSFSLPLIESISETRKSGLTFAVETPKDLWQLSINKEVDKANVVSILREAKKHGWRSAKFYFMIGLPVGDFEKGFESNNEEKEIVDFLIDIHKQTNMVIHVNVGTFIPKPHTAYQWAPQIDEKLAKRKLEYLRSALKPLGFKVGLHDPFVSSIEGLISRGNEAVSLIIEEAFVRGCRLDAWDDYIQFDVWRSLFENNQDLVQSVLGKKELSDSLPWDTIESGVGKAYLKREYQRSLSSELTSICDDNCTWPCGICGKDQGVVKNIIHPNVTDELQPTSMESQKIHRESVTHRILFSYTKQGSAIFIPHLSMIEVFSKAFMRASLPVQFTEGFNPLPKIDFASPLAIGIQGDAEIATVDLEEGIDAVAFISRVNPYLCEGISITQSLNVTINIGQKKYSVSSLLWGYDYKNGDHIDPVPFNEEKNYRQRRTLSANNSLFGFVRSAVYSRSDTSQSEDFKRESYFESYKRLYPL